MSALINPVRLAEPFDHADWVFEAKFDGFRAAADTVRGRLISRNGNWMHRFDEVLDLLPKGYVFDGELVVLDDARAPALQRAAILAPPADLRGLRSADGRWHRSTVVAA
jgi:ATP-dependent DNA ligase